MVVICPSCKIKLKVSEEKITPKGTRFKCPKCYTIFIVKKPVAISKKAVDYNKVLVAHSNPAIVTEVTSLLTKSGYQTVTASDGIEAIVTAIKEAPFLIIIEVALPKIYGFEVSKRVRARPGDKEVRIIYVVSSLDKKKYEGELASLPDGDDYIEDHLISERLMEKISAIKGIKAVAEKEEIETTPREPVMGLEQKAEPHVRPQVITMVPPLDEKTEKAKRLARTIISDIYLYNPQKVEGSIKNDTFYSLFALDIKEGLKLYETRVPKEVREKSDFFREAIEKFIANKKRALS